MEGDKYCTPVLPESNSIISLDAHLQGREIGVIVLQYGEAQASVISAAYTVTVLTVSLGTICCWMGGFSMCKDILAGLREDVNR